MTTAALLPTPGDPLLARYWVRNYEARWRGLVDELVVFVNGNYEGATVYADAGAKVEVVDMQIGHGEAMRTLLHMTTADTVVYVEDDAFVLDGKAMTHRLNAVESGKRDVLGCPRGGMDPAIAVAAEAKWGKVVGPDGSTGHGLWPAFLFARRAHLLGTSQRFESWTWNAGERIPGLGYVVPTDMTTDTMTTVAFELRDRFDIRMVVNHKELNQKVWPGYAPWFHAGGLSNDPAQAREGMGDSNEGRDWAHRFWWWRRVGHDYSDHIARAGVDVDYWTPILEPWIRWDDR